MVDKWGPAQLPQLSNTFIVATNPYPNLPDLNCNRQLCIKKISWCPVAYDNFEHWNGLVKMSCRVPGPTMPPNASRTIPSSVTGGQWSLAPDHRWSCHSHRRTYDQHAVDINLNYVLEVNYKGFHCCWLPISFLLRPWKTTQVYGGVN